MKDAIDEGSIEYDNRTTKEDLCRAYELYAKNNKLAIESEEIFGKIKKTNIVLRKEIFWQTKKDLQKRS